MDYEIFCSWWEYFRVISWAIFPPKEEILMNEKEWISDVTVVPLNHTLRNKSELEQSIFVYQYREKMFKLLSDGDKNKADGFRRKVKIIFDEEENRKKIIEEKAHGLIGQTGIIASVLSVAIPLINTNTHDPYFIIVIVLLILSLINFVVAGLHARNSVTMRPYQRVGLKDIIKDDYDDKPEYIFEQVVDCWINSNNNDIKGTYLKFSHWYFKAGFIIIIILALVLIIGIV